MRKWSDQKVNLLVFLSVALGVLLITSNLMALKIWELPVIWPEKLLPVKYWRVIWQIPVDAGIFLFPVTYIIGDLLVQIYGEKTANLVAEYSALMAVVTAIMLGLTRFCLPDYPGVDNSAFENIQAAVGRIFLASVAGFLAGQVVNNAVFENLRREDKTAERVDDARAIRRRALVSSLPAHLVDSLLFETLAFWGRVTAGEFLQQVIFALAAGILLEAALSWKLTPWIILRVEKKLAH